MKNYVTEKFGKLTRLNIIDQLNDFIELLPAINGKHVILHASLRYYKKKYPGLSPDDLFSTLLHIIGNEGSLIMPSFTYCFKKDTGYDLFDKNSTPSKVGALSEIFRLRYAKFRTSSPTHSFCLWGDIGNFITPENNPSSPLGYNSVLDILYQSKDSYILHLGTDLTSCSSLHYFENILPVPYKDTMCWIYMNISPIGVSITGETILSEIPGCSKSFNRLSEHVESANILSTHPAADSIKLYKLDSLLSLCRQVLEKDPLFLLCASGTCIACDIRRKAHIIKRY